MIVTFWSPCMTSTEARSAAMFTSRALAAMGAASAAKRVVVAINERSFMLSPKVMRDMRWVDLVLVAFRFFVGGTALLGCRRGVVGILHCAVLAWLIAVGFRRRMRLDGSGCLGVA